MQHSLLSNYFINFAITYALEVKKSVVPVWRKHCSMVRHRTPLPEPTFGDSALVACLWPQWEHFHHGNLQLLQIRALYGCLPSPKKETENMLIMQMKL